MTTEHHNITPLSPTKDTHPLDPSKPDTSAEVSTITTHTSSDEEPEASPLSKRSSEVILTPRTNLYTSDAGWTLIAALPNARRSQITLETEGAKLKLSAPHELEGVYKREFCFTQGTIWGDLSARWEGDLLYVDLQRASPIKRAIVIS